MSYNQNQSSEIMYSKTSNDIILFLFLMTSSAGENKIIVTEEISEISVSAQRFEVKLLNKPYAYIKLYQIKDVE